MSYQDTEGSEQKQEEELQRIERMQQKNYIDASWLSEGLSTLALLKKQQPENSAESVSPVQTGKT